MQPKIWIAIAIVGAAVSVGIGFLIGFSVRDTVKPDLDSSTVKRAICTFNAQDAVSGTIMLTEKEDLVQITGNLTGIEGRHGFHVHTLGNLGNGCRSAGSHYNPENNDHGGPMHENRHVGDLGNIDFIQRESIFNVMDAVVKLNGPHSIIGRAFVIHERHDDLGLGTAFDSKTTGAAGPRLACCVVGIAEAS